MSTLGDVIHESRILVGKTLREVASEIGISAMYISELETGKKIPLTGDVLPSIAEYYGLDVNELINLAFEDKKKSEQTRVAERVELSAARTRKEPGDLAYRIKNVMTMSRGDK